MFYVILCEGKTDSVIINQIMTKEGFTYIGSDKLEKKFEFKLTKRQDIDYFKKEEDTLAIWNVAGCSKIKDAIQQIEKVLKAGNKIDSLGILLDKDNNDSNDILKDISGNFEKSIDIQDNEWTNYNYIDEYEIEKQLRVIVTIVPGEKFGALETILLDAIENDGEEEKILVEKVKKFISELDKEKLSFLNKDRKKIKAGLGVTVNIIDPERTFKDIQPVFESIKWSEYPIIQEYFVEMKRYK